MGRIGAAFFVWLAVLALSAAGAGRAGAEPGVDAMGCLEVDPFASFRFHRYPPEEKSILRAEFDPADSDEALSGEEGIDRIATAVLTSLKTGCAPVRLVVVHGGADFDSRGKAFEDHVSVERAFQAMTEIKTRVDAARTAAVESGEIQESSVLFTFGGIGTHGAGNKNPSSEAQRAENRFVVVRFMHGPVPTPATGEETPAEEPAQDTPDEEPESE